MIRHWSKRILLKAAIVVVVAGAALTLLPLNFLRPGIERVLAKRLGRRVEVDSVSLNLLTGPGFSLSGVTIHEDPRAGIEPFAYAQTVEARVDLLGLLAGRRGFSSLRFGDATLNLVQNGAGAWNFQYLLDARPSDPPAVHLRGARVNLKFGDTKSVLYFDDADVDVTPGNQGSLDVRFSGAPARTDRQAQNLGHLFVRGSWMPAVADRPLNLRVDLEPSSLDGLAKLFGRTWFDLQGQVSLSAQMSGVPSRMAVTGELLVDEGRRSDFLPNSDAKWKLAYKGALDLVGQKVALDSVADSKSSPYAAHLEAANFMTQPQWEASVAPKEAPLGAVLDAARRIGAPLPEKLSSEGSVSGGLQYEMETGLTGNLEARDAAFTLPGSPTVRAECLTMKIGAQTVAFGPSVLALGDDVFAGEKQNAQDKQSTQIEASYKFDGSAAAEVKVTTRGMDIDGLRAFAAIAPLDRALGPDTEHTKDQSHDRKQGTWRGSIRYQRSATEEGAWTGDYSIENARVAVDGISDPIRIQSANISAGAGRLAVTRMKATAGDVAFAGEYRWEAKVEGSAAERPHKFKLQIAEASATELDRLFKPALIRGGGFIERTLRFGGASPAPDWLVQRKAEGTVAIADLTAGDHELAVDSARVVWEGTSLRFSSIDARLLDAGVEGAALKGDINVDLSEGAPQYRLTGKVAGVPYKGGRLDFEGGIEAAGDGLPLLASLRATGTLSGRSIAFSPDADFRNVSGRFQAFLQGTSLRWKFTDLEVTQGSDVYLGEGAAQADGKVVLDLINRGKQVRYTGSLVSLAAQP
ncbi:MAG TPA: AsmA family protein [Bryobacteraceae bacterium]|nr:AsmA family protein [Bryobacteraceae bacterium]